MSKLVTLNQQQHHSIKVDTDKVEAAAADLHMVPVVLSEFRKLIVHYPIVVSKNENTGQFMCSALMGLEAGENLFWQQGQWQGIYLPLQVSRQPFFLAKNEQGKGDDYLLCIDEEHAAVNNSSGQAIFNQDGSASDYLKAQQAQLSQLIMGEQQTHAFIQTLLQYKLLTAMSLDMAFVDGSKLKINGLYTIDEEQLAKLTGEQLQSLQAQELLAPIHAMALSTGQIYNLIDKKNQQIQAAEAWFKPAASA